MSLKLTAPSSATKLPLLLALLCPVIATLPRPSVASDLHLALPQQQVCTDGATVTRGHDLRGQVIVLTGGDSGIGLATAESLARANATVLIAAYNLAHGQEAAMNISAQTGNPHVSAQAIDLSNFTSVREFAAGMLVHTKRVDLLINDAGIPTPIAGLPAITPDGFERVFETNYLGHFLLTQLLLPALRASPRGGRVVSVSSYAMNAACVMARRHPSCLSSEADWRRDATTGTPPDDTLDGRVGPTNYGVSKFFQTAHMYELARRESAAGSNVQAYSMHPGVVQTAMTKQVGLTNDTCIVACLADMGRIVDKCQPGVCPILPAQAAATIIFLSVAAKGGLTSGEYYFECALADKPTPRGWSWERDPALLYRRHSI